jgi:hypothetical protein
MVPSSRLNCAALVLSEASLLMFLLVRLIYERLVNHLVIMTRESVR